MRTERERQGLTEREVAAKAGVSQKTVDNIEKAIGDASLKNIEAVALALGADLADLIRTGYDRGAIATSSTATELSHLVGQLTEDQRELALE